jgi:hypothetical protein
LTGLCGTKEDWTFINQHTELELDVLVDTPPLANYYAALDGKMNVDELTNQLLF